MARPLSIVSLFAETIGRHQPVFGRLVSAVLPRSTEDSIVRRSPLARVVNIRGKILTSSPALSLSSLSSFLRYHHMLNKFFFLPSIFLISLNLFNILHHFTIIVFSICACNHTIIARISALIRFLKF